MDKQGDVDMRNKQIVALFYGWTVILALILVTSMLLALILRFTKFNEPTLSVVTLTVGLLVLFIGGFVAGIKGKTKGWMIGGTIGIGFTLFIFFVQYLGYKQSFTLNQSLHHIGYLFSSLIGGVIGVNFVGDEKS